MCHSIFLRIMIVTRCHTYGSHYDYLLYILILIWNHMLFKSKKASSVLPILD